jgi:hypothetical protein
MIPSQQYMTQIEAFRSEIAYWKMQASWLKSRVNEIEPELCRLQHEIKMSVFLHQQSIKAWNTEFSQLKQKNIENHLYITKLQEELQCTLENKKIFENRRIRLSNFFDLQERQRFEVRRRIRKNFETSVAFLKTYGLQIDKVSIVASDCLDCDDFKIDIQDENRSMTQLQEYLYLKDMTNMSDYMYETINSRFAHDWPKISQIKNFRKSLNKDLEKNIFSNTKGFYLSVEDWIRKKIRFFKDTHKNKSHHRFNFKISADSTVVSRNLKVLNVTLTLINDWKNCTSQHGHQIIGK